MNFYQQWQIVAKFNIPLFYRYFYNHLSNYTKTIIRLRLVNIYILLDVLLCSIAEYFYELCRILTSP